MLSADPATILSCVAIDAVGLVQATKGNIRVFCTMAERFMECVKIKTRGCIGEEVNANEIYIWFILFFFSNQKHFSRRI